MVVRQEKLYEKVKHLMQEGDVTNSFKKLNLQVLHVHLLGTLFESVR